jgi:hypothetical protein
MAKSIRAPQALAVVVGMALSASALAHHSFAVFFDDSKSLVSIKGTVSEFQFKNPHGVIRLNFTDANGAPQEWLAETNSPSILERRGWTKNSLKAGEQIVVEGWPARDGSHHMRMRKVTRADGTPVGVPFEQAEQK